MAPDDRMPPAGFVGRAFGLDLDATAAIPGVPAAKGGASQYRATVDLVSAEDIDGSWPFTEAVPLVRRIYQTTLRPALTVDRSSRGYRVFAPRYGRHVVSLDGTRIRSALPNVKPWRWQRLLFAQVFPLAATLQGLELFHASAVAFGDRAVGFVAPSGTGKTSIAVHLVGRGATLVTDDVLALEQSECGVLAHPGGGMISVPPAQLTALTPEGRARVGEVIGRSDKLLVAAQPAPGPVPLGALYFVSRNGHESPDVRFERVEPDPRTLLGSSFITYLDSDAQRLTQLAVCSGIAGSVPLFEAHIPASRNAAEVAGAIERHAEANGMDAR